MNFEQSNVWYSLKRNAHGFVTIREPRSGDERARLKLFRFIQLWVLLSVLPIPNMQSVRNLSSIPFISNWNTCILDFFRFLDFLHFISYTFYEIIILSCDLTTSEQKKTLKKRCIYNLIDSCHFTYTYSLISQMLAF